MQTLTKVQKYLNKNVMNSVCRYISPFFHAFLNFTSFCFHWNKRFKIP